MKTLSTMTAALALLVGAGAVQAADVYSSGTGSLKDGTIATVGSPFAGFNIGVGVGAEWPTGGADTLFRGDLRGGYNVVNKEGWLAGVYGEVSLLSVPGVSDPLLGYGGGVKLGKVFGNSNLAYVYGGYDALSQPDGRVDGYSVGAGFETLIATHWTIGLEGGYFDYPNSGGDGFRAAVRTSFYVN